MTSDPGLHLIADGVAIEPLASEDGVYHFALERLPGEIWLASRCTVPAETDTTATTTRLLEARGVFGTEPRPSSAVTLE